VISQNAKWGHAGFYIDCHRMTVPENILLQKKHWLGLIRLVLQLRLTTALGLPQQLHCNKKTTRYEMLF